jgi:hypothetical protein
MRRGALLLTCVCSCLPWAGVALASKAPAPAPVAVAKDSVGHVAESDGWPDTREGAIARRWVKAFSAGETAMRRALPDLLTPEALAKHGMDERMERYRQFHDQIGDLTLVQVDKAVPGELTATLVGSDMKSRQFVFTVQTAPPYRLLNVSMLQKAHAGLGGFHH